MTDTVRPAPSFRTMNWNVVKALAAKDFRAVLRSKAVLYPMLLVPTILLLGVPALIGLATLSKKPIEIRDLTGAIPGGVVDPILNLPAEEQLLVLVLGYLLAPLFLIVPLMVSAVLAADTFAGEKDRHTLESLLHLPVSDRELLVGKIIVSLVPSVLISWIGFVGYALVINAIAWPRTHRVIVPTGQWMVLIFWVAPAVAVLGLGLMVRISARARSSQEANQLGGAVVLPLIFLAVGQSTGLLLMPVPLAFLVGVFIWLLAVWVLVRGADKFTRDRLAARM